jgi:hypothetical protein
VAKLEAVDLEISSEFVTGRIRASILTQISWRRDIVQPDASKADNTSRTGGGVAVHSASFQSMVFANPKMSATYQLFWFPHGTHESFH